MTINKILDGKEIMIDQEDLHFIEKYTYRFNNKNFYRGTTSNKKTFRVSLQNDIIKTNKNERIKFKDYNRFNFSRQNLEIYIPEYVPKSIYIGVYTFITYKNFKKRWLARIKDNKGKRINIGYYQTQNEAAEAYNNKAKEFFGNNAILNDIINTPETIQKNSNWLNTNIGKCWKQISKKQMIETIQQNTNDSNNEDNQYIIKFIEGNENSFGFLYSKYYNIYLKAIKHENIKRKKLSGNYNTKSRTGRNISYGEVPLDYEDIVINGSMKIMRSIKRGRFQGINFLSWSCKIMRNTWNDYARKKYHIKDWRTRQRMKTGRNRIKKHF